MSERYPPPQSFPHFHGGGSQISLPALLKGTEGRIIAVNLWIKVSPQKGVRRRKCSNSCLDIGRLLDTWVRNYYSLCLMMIVSQSGDKVRVLGIDENGYGPMLGPLVVTGVLLEFDGEPFEELKTENFNFPIKVQDSKKVFSRTPSSYAAGEILTWGILLAGGIESTDLRSMIMKISGEDVNLHPEIEVPVWARKAINLEIPAYLRKVGIRVLEIKAKILQPLDFNEMIEFVDNKALLDYLLFEHLLYKMEFDFDIAMMGKIGGTKFYESNFFMRTGAQVVETYEEKKEMSGYRLKLPHREFDAYFILNGDEKYLPITLASIIGKYLREIFMLSLNYEAGFKTPIPYASGYRHDSRTLELLEKLKEKYPEEEIVRSK